MDRAGERVKVEEVTTVSYGGERETFLGCRTVGP